MKFMKKDRRTLLEQEIDSLLVKLRTTPCNSKEYDEILAKCERLSKLKDMDVKQRKISPDAKAGILANALGIGLVLWHEKAHVIVSKAWGMVIRGKI